MDKDLLKIIIHWIGIVLSNHPNIQQSCFQSSHLIIINSYNLMQDSLIIQLTDIQAPEIVDTKKFMGLPLSVCIVVLHNCMVVSRAASGGISTPKIYWGEKKAQTFIPIDNYKLTSYMYTINKNNTLEQEIKTKTWHLYNKKQTQHNQLASYDYIKAKLRLYALINLKALPMLNVIKSLTVFPTSRSCLLETIIRYSSCCCQNAPVIFIVH